MAKIMYRVMTRGGRVDGQVPDYAPLCKDLMDGEDIAELKKIWGLYWNEYGNCWMESKQDFFSLRYRFVPVSVN